ncbi:MAG: CPBP family intramembrane glutamic endopeptidase [Lutibacter sp.]|jgi:hypothetical protein
MFQAIITIIRLTIYAFVLPPFRLAGLAIQLHPTQHPKFSYSHVIFDIFSVILVAFLFGLCHFWNGFWGLAGFLFLAIFLGIARRVQHQQHVNIKNEMQNVHNFNDAEDDRDGENDEENEAEYDEPIVVAFKTTEPKIEKPKERKIAGVIIPDYPEDDPRWPKWIQENKESRGLIRCQKR